MSLIQPSPGYMKVWKYTHMQVCKFANLLIRKYARLYLWKYANTSMEVCYYAYIQICMYVSVQCKYTSVYENMQESIQICKYEKYAGMYVYTN